MFNCGPYEEGNPTLAKNGNNINNNNNNKNNNKDNNNNNNSGCSIADHTKKETLPWPNKHLIGSIL